MKTRKFLFFIILSSLFLCLPLQASLKKEIKRAGTTPTVIVPDPDPKNIHHNNGYRLQVFTPEDFSTLCELIDPNVLENANFKVVENEGSEALPVGNFDGDNVLYHLMMAKAYYTKLATNSGRGDDALQHKIYVRIHVTEGYNDATHFAKTKQYNDARYIPADPDEQWQQEIFMHSRHKKLEGFNWKVTAAASGLSIALGQAMLLPVSISMELYEHYNAGMDTEKMPNAIYHEAFHWATDTQGLFPMAGEGNPVAENYANYFGSSLTGRPMLLEIKEYTSKYYKRNYAKIERVKNVKTSMYNYSAFVPSLFWKIRNILGPERADQIIWNTMYDFEGLQRHVAIPAAIMIEAKKDTSITQAQLDEISFLLDSNYASFANLDRRFQLTNPRPPAPHLRERPQAADEAVINAADR